MTMASMSEEGPPAGPLTSLDRSREPLVNQHDTRISGRFQFFIALCILLTGSVPTVVQAAVFGISGGGGSEFALAVLTQTIHDLLLIIALAVLANNPLGILHPLLLALVLWPLFQSMPYLIPEYGGWAGVFAGSPVKAPHFYGLPSRSAGAVWTAISKYNSLRSLSLICTYVGFLAFSRRPDFSRRPLVMRYPVSVRAVMIGLIVVSLIVLIIFVRARGGMNAHLTSLGTGRFKELAGDGLVMLAVDLGATAIYIWVAAMPGDVKSPFFLFSLAAVTAAEFISNGSRGGALEVPLTVGLIWAIMRRKIPWKIALILVPFMFVSIGLLGAIRTSSWTGSTANEALSRSGWSSSLARTQEEIDARQATSAPVPVVERGFELSGGPLLGSSYAAPLVAFIPRAFWHDKPRGVGSLYARLFLGASFSGTTIPIGPEPEMYWNFGLPGVVLLSIIYGVLLRGMYMFFWRRYPNPFAIVFYVMFLTTFTFSSDVLVGFEQKAFLILVCYVFVATFTHKISYPSHLLANRLLVQPRGALSDRPT
jgi:hypothetical protein